jgi:hypothetical protein
MPSKIIHRTGKRKHKLYTRKGKGNKIIHNKGKRKQNYTQEREKETKLYTTKGKGNTNYKLTRSTPYIFPMPLFYLYFSPLLFSSIEQNRTEQNRIFIGLKSIYKGLLPKQHIKYKTKKLLVIYNQTSLYNCLTINYV